MSDMSLFFSSNSQIVEEVVVSKRFKDPKGAPVPWKIRNMTEAENQAIRKSSTKQVKGKNGVRSPETDMNEYLGKMAAASILYPDLKNKELQDSYHAIGAEDVLRKMLLPGEFGTLIQTIQEINGFDQDMEEVIDEVKN